MSSDERGNRGLSRRGVLGTGAAAIAGVGLSATPARGAIAGHAAAPDDRGQAPGAPGGDLALVGGKILTQDHRNGAATDVIIRAGRFAEVGRGLRVRGSGVKVIDLKGRTVIPGIIDCHNHIVLMGLRPGHHTPLENAASIAEALATLKARAAGVPTGRFVTTIGGFHSNQFAERRLPTLAEIDAAVPDHPVYLQIGFSGPATTNGLGRSFFAAKGVPVGADGSIAIGEAAQTALFELRQGQTLEVERSIRAELTVHRPDDGFLGEETPPSDGGPADGGRRRWVVDPIDYTNNFVRGIPAFATLIALMADGVVEVGVVSAPALGRRWWARRGHGAFADDGRRLRVSAVADLADAYLSYAAVHRWQERGRLDGILELSRRARFVYGSGGFWAHMQVAEGLLEASLDPWGKVWDLAAIQVIVEEAGGSLTDTSGVARVDGGCAVVTNGALHATVLSTLMAEPEPAP